MPAPFYTSSYMIPSHVRALFWDVDADTFQPEAYPDYTIFRVLEYGDVEEVAWLRQTFSEGEIRRALRAESRLSEKSANFWALVYEVPSREVAALNRDRYTI